MLLHCTQDKFVPLGHGQWLAAHIPGVEARLLEGDGHLTLLEHHLGTCTRGWQAVFSADFRVAAR